MSVFSPFPSRAGTTHKPPSRYTPSSWFRTLFEPVPPASCSIPVFTRPKYVVIVVVPAGEEGDAEEIVDDVYGQCDGVSQVGGWQYVQNGGRCVVDESINERFGQSGDSDPQPGQFSDKI